MGDFTYLTAIYVIIMWCTDMMDGMNFFAGMLVMNDNPPKWLYYFYIVQQAVLWPITSLILFYVHSPTGSMNSCTHCFDAILAGAYLYIGFRMMYQFQQAFKDDSDTKNRIIQGVTLAIDYLWFCFIGRIWINLNNYLI